jgi:hypothetical protein
MCKTALLNGYSIGRKTTGEVPIESQLKTSNYGKN